MTDTTRQGRSALQVEMQGIDVIADVDRKGSPRDLFWPWFAANVSVLGISYGSWVLGFGISFGQATLASVIGILVSFLLCGFVSLAGKRGSAPTMVLSRAALGVRGNRVASVLSWILTVGWETVLTALATLATATVFARLGWGGGDTTKVIALIVVALLIIAGGVIGFDLIMRMQTVITIVTGVLTIGYVALVYPHINWAAVSAIPDGSAEALIGALVFMMTGFGLGWVNMAADYSRYLPRHSSSGGGDRLDHLRRLAGPAAPRGLRPAAGRLGRRAERGHLRRPDRRPDHPAAHLVPGAVRDRRGRRARRRRRARHLLLRARTDRSGPADQASGRRRHRRRDHGARHGLHRLRERELHRCLPWAS